MTRLWNLPVFRLVATDRCRVAAPWFDWTNGRDATAVLRQHANALERHRFGPPLLFEQELAALLHLVLAGPRALLALRRWGQALRASEGISFHRQWLDLLTCTWRLGLRPQVYYYLGLHRLARREWRHVIDPAELHHLQRDISPPDIHGLEDKLRFHDRASRAGIATPPLLALWRDGRRESAADPEELRRDLFVKRALTYSSTGIMGFRFDATTGEYRDGPRRYSPAGLDALLRRLSYDHVLLVQPWLRNHRDLEDFSTGALCNYRVVTGRHPNGSIEPLVAALRLPVGRGLTCAEPDLTFCAAVEIGTGRLHAAASKDPALGQVLRHPATGRRIEGVVVPRWPELLALARRAHEAWPEFPFVGWDLADTSGGLVVLEGSCLWGGFLAQMSGSPPLGLTSFASIYHSYSRHRGSSPCPFLPGV